MPSLILSLQTLSRLCRSKYVESAKLLHPRGSKTVGLLPSQNRLSCYPTQLDSSWVEVSSKAIQKESKFLWPVKNGPSVGSLARILGWELSRNLAIERFRTTIGHDECAIYELSVAQLDSISWLIWGKKNDGIFRISDPSRSVPSGRFPFEVSFFLTFWIDCSLAWSKWTWRLVCFSILDAQEDGKTFYIWFEAGLKMDLVVRRKLLNIATWGRCGLGLDRSACKTMSATL
jgi:hypothetical protein